MAELIARDAREREFARMLGRLSSRHKRELTGLLGDPPDASRVPNEFWERVRRETEHELVALLLLIFMASATQHGLDVPAAQIFGFNYARQRASIVAASYTTTGREMLVTGDAFDRGRLIQIFGPDRIDTLTVSEVTQAVSAGSEEWAAQTVGLQDADTWFTVQDEKVCPICEPLHEMPRQIWSAEFPSGPPAHPRCRCWIEYSEDAQEDL